MQPNCYINSALREKVCNNGLNSAKVLLRTDTRFLLLHAAAAAAACCTRMKYSRDHERLLEINS